MDWHARFRAAREAAGLSQGQLGARVGVGYRSVLRWEKGHHLPSPEQQHALAGISPEFAALILELDSEPQPVDLEQLIRRTVIEVLHEVQFPRLEALEVQVQQRADADTVARGFAHLEAAIERLSEQLSSQAQTAGRGSRK